MPLRAEPQPDQCADDAEDIFQTEGFRFRVTGDVEGDADRHPSCPLLEEFQDRLGLEREAVGLNPDAAKQFRGLKHETIVVGDVLGEEKVDEPDVAFRDDATVPVADFGVDDERDNDISFPPCPKNRQETLDRVLVVGGENHGVGKSGCAQASLEGTTHAEVDGVIERADARITVGDLFGDFARAIGAAIVDDEDFEIQSGLSCGIRCGENRCLEGFFLVVGGDDDGEAVFQSFNGSMGEMIIDGGFWMRDGKGRDEKGKPEDVEGRVASVGTRME